MEQNLISNGDKESDSNSVHENKYIDSESFNEDLEESNEVVKKATILKPYFSNNILPSTLYLQRNVLPLILEALREVEKIRPKDPIEFFAAYILEKS